MEEKYFNSSTECWSPPSVREPVQWTRTVSLLCIRRSWLFWHIFRFQIFGNSWTVAVSLCQPQKRFVLWMHGSQKPKKSIFFLSKKYIPLTLSPQLSWFLRRTLNAAKTKITAALSQLLGLVLLRVLVYFSLGFVCLFFVLGFFKLVLVWFLLWWKTYWHW